MIDIGVLNGESRSSHSIRIKIISKIKSAGFTLD